MPDHDQHFKKLIETCFADLVRIVAPRIAPKLHLDRPTFLDKEQFTGTARPSSPSWSTSAAANPA